ncbi:MULTISPECIES: hypothetical protein [unclassified Ruegeria]|uniref:hypothetical protein n=1 Tax=unclassified Ruegeria TaxID=2625375 RepID=UPI0014888DD2|nr:MULTISPECIES: hypothetical protein [unclassified Ruegeria]
MAETSWFEILSRISPKKPVRLDDLITDGPKMAPLGKVLFPETGLAPAVDLWDRDGAGSTHIGIRIVEAPEDVHDIARLLAAAALERSVEPVILSRVDFCGFEQFGFRIERLPDDPKAALAAEEELRKFWDLAIIIDGQDIGLLG